MNDKLKNGLLNLGLVVGIILILFGGYNLIRKKNTEQNADSSLSRITSEQKLELEHVQEFCSAGQFDKASQLLRKMIKQDPDNPYLIHDLGVILAWQEKFEEAIICFNKAIEMNPQMVRCYFNRAQAKLLSGNFKEAYQEYISIKILFPDLQEYADKGIEVVKNVRQYAKKDFQSHLEKRVELDNEDTQALFTLGKLAMEDHDFSKAHEYFEKIVEFQPDFKNASFNLINTLIVQKKFDEAISILEKQVAEKPDDMELQDSLAFTYLQTGKIEKAKKMFMDIISAMPDNTQALIGQAIIALRQGEYKSAHEFLNRVVQLAPDAYHARHMLGMCLIAQGQFDQAVEQFTYIINNSPTFFTAYKSLADAYLRKTDYANAAKWYKKYLELVPDDEHRQHLEEFIKAQES